LMDATQRTAVGASVCTAFGLVSLGTLVHVCRLLRQEHSALRNRYIGLSLMPVLVCTGCTGYVMGVVTDYAPFRTAHGELWELAKKAGEAIAILEFSRFMVLVAGGKETMLESLHGLGPRKYFATLPIGFFAKRCMTPAPWTRLTWRICRYMIFQQVLLTWVPLIFQATATLKSNHYPELGHTVLVAAVQMLSMTVCMQGLIVLTDALLALAELHPSYTSRGPLTRVPLAASERAPVIASRCIAGWGAGGCSRNSLRSKLLL